MKLDIKQVEKEMIKFGVWLTGNSEELIAKKLNSYNKFEEPADQSKSREGCEQYPNDGFGLANCRNFSQYQARKQ